jgi:hypothetical protein
MMLAERVRERLGAAAIRTGARVSGVAHEADGATVRWHEGGVPRS